MKNKIDKNLYKKAREFEEEIQNFIKQKRKEENSLIAKNKKEIEEFENTKRNEKYKFCIENGGHFFKGYVGYQYVEYSDCGSIIETIYYRNCDLCGFRETKYDLAENDIFDYWENEYL